MTWARGCVFCLFSLVLMGCGGAKPTVGGTEGLLHSGDIKLSEIQITIYRMDRGTPQPIGLGIPGTDGVFRLVANEAKGPLRLSPGEYRCVLESIGAPMLIPKEYTDANTTPLKVVWSASDRTLELNLPAFEQVR